MIKIRMAFWGSFWSIAVVLGPLAWAPGQADGKIGGPEVPGRSLAALQETEFDSKLDRYRQCYGIKVSYKQASVGRRRACKALLVHRLGDVLAAPGAYFSVPLRFECQNTAKGYTKWINWENHPVLKLKPNQEYKVIDLAITNYLKTGKNSSKWLKAKKACDFLIQCRGKLSWSQLSFDTVRRCFWNTDELARSILRDELLASLFKRETKGMLVQQMLK